MESPLTIVALLLAASAAHVTLFKRVDDFLKEVRTCINKSKKRKWLKVAIITKWLLIRVGWLGATALVLTVIRWFSPPSDISNMPIHCAFLDFFVPVLTGLDLFLLLPIGLVVISFILEYTRREITDSLSLIKAAIYLRNGKEIRGTLLNLDLLMTMCPFPFVLEDNTITYIDRAEVQAVFVRESLAQRGALDPKRFTEGPKTLKLTFPNGELFHSVRYYDRSGFRILQVNKLTTSTRYAIVRPSLIQANPSTLG